MSKNKTVRKGFLSKILFLLALFIVVCIPASFAAVASCSGVSSSGTRYGIINGKCWAYYCSNGSMTQLGSVDSSYCASCSGVKYAPSGSCGTCEYKCCSDGNWSECNKECPDPSEACSSSQCWDGSKCASRPTGKQYDGKCYFTWASCTCNKGSGWSCSGKTYEKKQTGKWTTWGDVVYSNSKPSSTCQQRVISYLVPSSYSPSDSLAATVCTKQAAGVTGTPEGTTTWSGSCTVIGNCSCVDYSGSYIGDGNAYCSTRRYKCQVRTVQCSEEPCN